MPLKIFTGNRLEALVVQLGEVVNQPLSSPLEQEVIIVQSKGMQRWLAMEFARRNGVWANCAYPFPNKLLGNLLEASGLNSEEMMLFDQSGMTWRIMRLCSDLIDKPEFGELKGYLRGANSLLKRYQLAGRIADTFDQYTLFRAEMLKDWEAGNGVGWQPILWRAVLAEIGNGHRGRMQEKLLEKLGSGQIDRDWLPSRLSVFGISSLPQFHLNVLAALSNLTEVNMFILSPCRQYWADLLSPKASSRLPKEEREMLGEGHPLLASLGKLGRDFSRMILDLENVHGGERDLYCPVPGSNLLSDIQNGILDLRESGSKKQIIGVDDRSFQIHSCHSPMREVEVLHDQLLNMFDTLEGLCPKDILVMSPDIETYAPYVTAVFDGVQDRRRRIQFSIADRSLKNEGEIAKAFIAILEMAGGRFTAPEVMDILSSPPVRRKFGLSEDDFEVAKSMLQETKVCWGMDENDRTKQNLPSYRDHSWKSGFDRLLLGYALPVNGLETFEDIYPFDNIEGGKSLVLGKLVTFARHLHKVVDSLSGSKRLSEWTILLKGILDSFFETEDSSQREFTTINTLFDELGTQEIKALYQEEVGLEIVNSWLEGKLDRSSKGFGYMNGGVTFCAMLPMRSVPFRVVVLLGMNDGGFPRQDRPPGFDLISQGPRQLGDRSLREEDRYLFLEALLSARDVLLITYVGQSLKDNSTVPPSVLVSELMDYLNKNYTIGEQKPDEVLITKHRLQPFNTEYFEGSEGLFSYSAENLAAATQRQAVSDGSGPFINGRLCAPSEELRNTTISSLGRFFTNPAKFFTNTRLGIWLENNIQPLEEREPFELNGLDRYNLIQEAVSLELEGGEGIGLLPVARSRGQLPPGKKGDQEFSKIVEEGKSLAERVSKLFGKDEKLAPLDVDLRIGDFTVRGRIDDIWPNQLIRYRNAKLGGKDIVKIWIDHLILNAVAPEGYPLESILVVSNAEFKLGPVKDSGSLLERLLLIYWDGLHCPIKFFPRSSLEHAKTGNESKVKSKWDYGDFAEKLDPYFNLCFGKTNPLDQEFMATAEAVFTPCLGSEVGE